MYEGEKIKTLAVPLVALYEGRERAPLGLVDSFEEPKEQSKAKTSHSQEDRSGQGADDDTTFA